MTVKTENGITFSQFLVACVLNAVAVWGAVILLALVFAEPLMHRSLVPAPVLFVLAGPPIVIFTAVVQGLLYLAAKRLSPGSSRFCILLIGIGTAPVTLLVLWTMTVLVGGVDFFIPRL